MEESYWELFWVTGAPIFYLLYRREEDLACEARTASAEQPAADV